MPTVIGVDIGGSHISSAAVNINTHELIPNTYFKGEVKNKTSKNEIFKSWGEILNKTLAKSTNHQIRGVGIAMPGPFKYKTGIAMFEKNDKYEALYNISVSQELSKILSIPHLDIRFLNDASSFGVGSAWMRNKGNNKKIIAITLGTGFGVAFLKENIPVVNGLDVPKGGCLWDKPFNGGIADDFFSTRWFVLRYQQITGHNGISDVKEIANLNNYATEKVFKEFSHNVSEFLIPHLEKFNADLLIIGGNISRSHPLFLSTIKKNWKKNKINIPVDIIEDTDHANIIGSSFLFNNNFWLKVKDELPES